MTWDRNISRIAARAESGASTPIRGTTLSATTYGVAAPATSCDLGAGVDVAGDHDGPGPAARPRCPGPRRRSPAALPPSVPPVSSTTSGRGRAPQARQARRRAHDPRGDDLDHPAAAGERDPAAGLGGDQLLVADDGDPQPAAGGRAGQHLGARRPAGPARAGRPGTRRTRRARRSRSSSACDAWATIRPSARSTSAALVKVEPKSTQIAVAGGSAEGTVEVGEQVVDRSRCRR